MVIYEFLNKILLLQILTEHHFFFCLIPGIYYNHNNFNNDYYMINSTRSPAQILDSIDTQQRMELEDIIDKLDRENK